MFKKKKRKNHLIFFLMDFSQLISSLRYIEKKVKEHKLPKYSSKILLFLLIFLNLLTADEVD